VEFLVVLIVIAIVVLVVTSPLRPGRAGAAEAVDAAERAALEAARDAKYREIRDAELDRRTGKLSDADWREQDRALRGEAVEVLRRLDALDADPGRTAS
jgi:type II secretory pathway pseudopilin PulG